MKTAVRGYSTKRYFGELDYEIGVFSAYCVIWTNFHENKNPLLDVILEMNNRVGSFFQQKWP